MNPYKIKFEGPKAYIEFADSSSHFSKNSPLKPIIQLNEGKFALQATQNSATLTALTDSYLMDFVVGYSFPKTWFDSAIINNQKIIHQDSRRRHQHPVTQAILISSFNQKITIDFVVQTANLLTPVMYVRDFKDSWIIHCRLLPKNYDKEIIKINFPLKYQAIPQQLSDYILKNYKIKKYLWYRAETKPYSIWNLLFKYFRPSAYPLVLIPKNKTISITCNILQ